MEIPCNNIQMCMETAYLLHFTCNCSEFLVLYVWLQYFEQIWQTIYEFNISTNHTCQFQEIRTVIFMPTNFWLKWTFLAEPNIVTILLFLSKFLGKKEKNLDINYLLLLSDNAHFPFCLVLKFPSFCYLWWTTGDPSCNDQLTQQRYLV